MALEIEIEPLYLQDSTETAGKFKLRTHQAELRNSNDPCILLEAPTSSGKTLAFLLRSLENFDNTILLYPTNTLMWDQAHSISNLISLLGYSCATAVEEKESTITWQDQNVNSADVGLYVINADTLSVLVDNNRSSEGLALLQELRKAPHKRIILTNPEVLYLLFTYKFAQASKLLDEVLLRVKTGNLLVVDEFHLYHGYSLAVMSYLLYMLRGVFTQKIFTSATPSSLDNLLLEPIKSIKARIGHDTIVRHKTLLAFEEYDEQRVLGRHSIGRLLRKIEELYDSHRASSAGVKLVIILNSVLTAVSLASSLEQLYPQEVVPIHGLVPRRARSRLKPIVVGTSAIEVGVDFDTSSLIFEANESSTFIQRLGRGGRHHKCDAVCYIPVQEIPSLKKHLPDHPVEYNGLKDIIIRTMPSESKYYNFIWSKQGAEIFYALLLSLNQHLIQRDSRMGYAAQAKYKHMKLLKKQILDSTISSPEPITSHLKEIVSNGNMPAINALSFNMSVRSSLSSIPAFFSKYDSFDSVSFQDVPRLDFETMKLKDAERQIKIPYKMRRYEKILWVNSIRDEPISLRISFDRKFFFHPRKLRHEQEGENNNFDIYIRDSQSEAMREHVINLINYQPACSILWKEDWRMTGLYGENGFLAIGGDAFLADYLKDGIR
jgi:DEAD/DEAH box helicase